MDLPRRRILTGLAAVGGGTAMAGLLPDWARAAYPGSALPALTGEDIKLVVDHASVVVDGRRAHAVTVNGSVPGPLIRLKEGQTVRISVTNRLAEETSIHWHGLLVPFHMDGVPGVSFPGIPPGQTFTYEFAVRQAGTYWYHSHSGLQEQEGHYGPIIIDPVSPEPAPYDREHVVVLSDFSTMHPHAIFRRLKQQGGVFNDQRQTVAGLLTGKDQSLAERIDWAAMLMDPTDISDVTGVVYKYLINGHAPKDNWTGLFGAGERVRLRFINAAAQSVFNVRIPGLRMTVVQADGQDVRPVEVDEFQMGNAETYDVIVRPLEDRAYALVAESVDRSGMAVATLAPRAGMIAAPPALRRRPLGTMKDMGMDMSSMGGMEMDMSMLNPSNAPQVKMGPGVQMISPMPVDRTGEPGQGLEAVGHRVLVYRDLIALQTNPDTRAPSRSVEIRLTGNMERFMWGFDGWKFSDRPKPYTFTHGERVRVNLVNDTMMAHPIHMHGHFFDLIHGPEGHLPRKHTVTVLPGGRVTFDFTPEAGDWAFHCHMLYHMHAGMFQVIAVRPLGGGQA